VTALCVLALALAGCGGPGKDDAETTVRDFAKAANARDGDGFCRDLVTDDFVDAAFGSEKTCRAQLKGLKNNFELVAIEKVTVDGDKATVVATIQSGGQRSKQTLDLREDGGKFKLTGGAQ